MVVFVYAQVSMTALLLSRLNPEQHHSRWNGSFEDVLPFLCDAFAHDMESFQTSVPTEYRRDIVDAVSALCDPDPNLRCRPLSTTSLTRYVTQFDLLARRTELVWWRVTPSERSTR
jgi:hypothetical protein